MCSQRRPSPMRVVPRRWLETVPAAASRSSTVARPGRERRRTADGIGPGFGVAQPGCGLRRFPDGTRPSCSRWSMGLAGVTVDVNAGAVRSHGGTKCLRRTSLAAAGMPRAVAPSRHGRAASTPARRIRATPKPPGDTHAQRLRHRHPRRHRLHRPAGGRIHGAALPQRPQRRRPALGDGRAQCGQAGGGARRHRRAGRHAAGADRHHIARLAGAADAAHAAGAQHRRALPALRQ